MFALFLPLFILLKGFLIPRFLSVAALILVLVLLLVTSSLAAPVSLHFSNMHAVSGLSIDIYFAGPPASDSAFTVDTANLVYGNSGFFVLPEDVSAHFRSPQFIATTEVPSGKLILDLWVSHVVQGSDSALAISACTTDNEGTVVDMLCSGEVTEPLSEDSQQLTCFLNFAAGTVPASGYLEIALTAPTDSAMKICWGNGQPTNFQFCFTNR